MDSGYKAIQYKVITHHEEIIDNDEPWNNIPAYDTSEVRYCIISTEKGEILDDAQGYGYKTARNAYSAYAYKIRDKSKDKGKRTRETHIKQWLTEHESFVEAMDRTSLEIAKGSRGANCKFDAAFVKEMLSGFGLKPDFTANELLRVWKKM